MNIRCPWHKLQIFSKCFMILKVPHTSTSLVWKKISHQRPGPGCYTQRAIPGQQWFVLVIRATVLSHEQIVFANSLPLCKDCFVCRMNHLIVTVTQDFFITKLEFMSKERKKQPLLHTQSWLKIAGTSDTMANMKLRKIRHRPRSRKSSSVHKVSLKPAA